MLLFQRLKAKLEREQKQEQDNFSEPSPAKGKGKSKVKWRVKGRNTFVDSLGIRVLHDANVPNVEYGAFLPYEYFLGKPFTPLSLCFSS